MQAASHVVVGSGVIGREVARLLAERGERVRIVTRSGSGPEHPLIERVAADAADPVRLTELTAGTAALYNCASPAYHRWATDWPPLAASLLVAAERSGAVLVTMSNLYGYGPCPMPMTERTPLAATSVKGQVRARMWRDALAAHEAGRARVTEVRASDYLGVSPNSFVHGRVVPALLAGRKAQVLGDPDAPHTFTWTRDIARMLVTAAGDERAWGRAWHVPSHDPVTPRELVADLCRAAGVAPVEVTTLSPWVLRLGGLFSPVLRELPEVAYQTAQPFIMDSSAATTTFGLVASPWDDILTDTLGRS
ncbi:MAG: NAD-dependent epimerase/dehydratase family protein [Actinobacteria bacterium]|nr:NAD-dependent epimerase/dehydratase family protein [Actinomycetota bacterium]